MYRIIIFLGLSVIFANSFIPSNGQEINYTQVFFKWPQIPQTNEYQFKIFQNGESEELFLNYSTSNSLLVENILNWGESYIWEVCGTESYSNLCHIQNYFIINSLPEYHPDEIDITSYNENYYQEGINILDFESLGYSLAIDEYGNTIWFADKNNFYNSNIISAELLANGNFTGFSYGRGYEFTIDSEIIFEIFPILGLHKNTIYVL